MEPVPPALVPLILTPYGEGLSSGKQPLTYYCVCVCVCVRVRREVITYSRQQRALQPVFELCWEEPVLLWPRPQPRLTGKSLRISQFDDSRSVYVCLSVCLSVSALQSISQTLSALFPYWPSLQTLGKFLVFCFVFLLPISSLLHSHVHIALFPSHAMCPKPP